MPHALVLFLWVALLAFLGRGIQLVEKAADHWEEAFRVDYELTACGRFRAFEANMNSALITWRKLGCGEEGDGVDDAIGTFISKWRGRYPQLDFTSCSHSGRWTTRLHREQNANLDKDYPNWVVKYGP